MGTLDEVKRMQEEGKTDGEIVSYMQQIGVPMSEINDALNQSKIKLAVSGAEQSSSVPKPSMDSQGMQPSVLVTEHETSTEAAPPATQAYSQEYSPPAYPVEEQYSPQQEYQYQQYQSTPLSSDTLTEIAEQVVTEKLSSLRNKIESILDTKTLLESKIEGIDERLKRIEKIIDRLQLSILQKVGEYVTNVDDLKREVVETQKSFKSLLPSNRTQKTEN